MQWHFPLFLGCFEKNIVVNNLLFEYLKNTTRVYDYFLLNYSGITEEKREGVRALYMIIGATSASSENSVQKSSMSAFCTHLL